MTLAACGSSSTTSNTSATSTTASQVAATSTPSAAAQPKGTPLTIMVTTGINTPQGSFPGDYSGAQAAALEINGHGGANGHPVKIVTCNNMNTPAGATTCARQAVSQKVDAVVGTVQFGQVVYPTLAAAQTPSSFYTITGLDLQTPTNFPMSGGGWVTLIGQPLAAKRAGATKLGIVCATLPGFSTLCANAKSVAVHNGMTVVALVPLSLTTTTFSSQVQQLRSAGANGVLFMTTAAQMAPFMQAANAVGYTPAWTNSLGSFSVPVLQAASRLSKKLWLTSAYPPASSASQYPGMAAYTQEMSAAGKAGIENTSTPNQTESSINAWAAVHGFADVAKTLSGDVTAASLLAAVKTATNVNVSGLLTWSPGAPGNPKYPGLKDNGLQYSGPVANGVYAPNPHDPTPALAGVQLQ
jgi:ABC-type branched-subunit amino acid transport system substrate-binding protein